MKLTEWDGKYFRLALCHPAYSGIQTLMHTNYFLVFQHTNRNSDVIDTGCRSVNCKPLYNCSLTGLKKLVTPEPFVPTLVLLLCTYQGGGSLLHVQNEFSYVASVMNSLHGLFNLKIKHQLLTSKMKMISTVEWLQQSLQFITNRVNIFKVVVQRVLILRLPLHLSLSRLFYRRTQSNMSSTRWAD